MPTINDNSKNKILTTLLKVFMCSILLLEVMLILFTLYTYINVKNPINLPGEIAISDGLLRTSESEVTYKLYERQSVSENDIIKMSSNLNVSLLLMLRDKLDNYANTGIMESIEDSSSTVEKIFEIKEISKNSNEFTVVDLYPMPSENTPYNHSLDCDVSSYRTINDPGEFVRCLVSKNVEQHHLLSNCAKEGLIIAYICSSPYCFGGTKECYFYERK